VSILNELQTAMRILKETTLSQKVILMNNLLIVLMTIVLTSCSLLSTIRINNAVTNGYLKQTAFKTEIPFSQINGSIVIAVPIEGELYNFIFDTGAPTVIDLDLAKKLKVEKLGRQKVFDSQGQSKSLSYVKIRELSVGELNLFETVAVLADFSFISKESCLKVSGIFGANLMNKAIWQIDYKQNKIIVSDYLESLSIPAKSITIDFQVNRLGTPKFNLNLDNTNYEVILDTGSSGTITLCNKINGQPMGSLEWVMGYGTTSGFFGNEFDTTRLAKIPLMKLGESFEVKDVVIKFTKKTNGNLVGNNFLKNYLVTIDWRSQKITLSESIISETKSFISFGFKPTFSNNKLIVGFLYQKSQAYETGLRLNEQILKINQWDFSVVDQTKYCDFIKSELLQKADQLSIVVSREGKESTLELIKTDLLNGQ
jgi:hypothetical protein